MKNTWLWAGIIVIVVTISLTSVFGLYNEEIKCGNYDFSKIEGYNSETTSNLPNYGMKNECDQIHSNMVLSHIILALGVATTVIGFVFHK